MSQRARTAEILSLRPVIGQRFVIACRRLRDHVGDLFKQDCFVPKILHIIDRIPVIQIHRAPGRAERRHRLLRQRSRIYVEEYPLQLMPLKRHQKIRVKVGDTAVGADCFDRMNRKSIVKPAIVIVFDNRRTRENRIIPEVAKRSRHLIFLVCLDSRKTPKRRVIVEERVRHRRQNSTRQKPRHRRQQGAAQKCCRGIAAAALLFRISANGMFISHTAPLPSLKFKVQIR